MVVSDGCGVVLVSRRDDSEEGVYEEASGELFPPVPKNGTVNFQGNQI